MQTFSLPRVQPAAGPQALVALPAAGPGPALGLQAKADEAAALLKALANPGRLLLLCQLVAGERSVNELGSLAGIGQPSLSQQLAVLRGERLVATRREGKQVVYRIASPAALTVLNALYGLFCEPAHESTPGRSQVDSSPSGGGGGRLPPPGGAHESTPGRSQVDSSPSGGRTPHGGGLGGAPRPSPLKTRQAPRRAAKPGGMDTK